MELLLLLGLLALAASGDKKRAPGADEFFAIVNGQRAYKPIPQQQIFDSLIFRVLYPTGEEDTVMLILGDGRVFGPDELGAWFMVKMLHEQGFNIWSQPNLHLPFAEAPLVLLQPGVAPPAGLALLLAADAPYPVPPPGLVEMFGPAVAA